MCARVSDWCVSSSFMQGNGRMEGMGGKGGGGGKQGGEGIRVESC